MNETKSELREEFYQQTTNFNFNFDDFLGQKRDYTPHSGRKTSF